MKNLLIGLFIMGFTSLGLSQSLVYNSIESELGSNLVTLNGNNRTTLNKELSSKGLNTNYLKSMHVENKSMHIKLLEDEVASFNLVISPQFDKSKKYFKVVFRSNKGSILAIYNNKGELLSTKERYEDIKIPNIIRNSLSKRFPKWTLEKINYFTDYSKDTRVKEFYKIQIRKGSSVKNVKIDSQGNIN